VEKSIIVHKHRHKRRTQGFQGTARLLREYLTQFRSAIFANVLSRENPIPDGFSSILRSAFADAEPMSANMSRTQYNPCRSARLGASLRSGIPSVAASNQQFDWSWRDRTIE
jgi:hypothetical protein